MNVLKRPVTNDPEWEPEPWVSKRQQLSYVCYGSLCKINTRLQGSYQRFRNSLSPEDYYNDQVLKLQVVLIENKLALQTRSERTVAVLNMKAASALCGAKTLASENFNDVTLEAYVNETDLHQLAEMEKENLKFLDFLTEINIYGSIDDVEKIGKYLSKCDQFLQRPRYDPYLTQPLNPHEIFFSHNGCAEELHPTSNVDFQNGWMGAQQQSINSIFENLPQHNELDAETLYPHVVDALYPHQRQGVAFILRRERKKLIPSQSLWRLQYVRNTVAYYRHLITGDKQSAPPEELQGGIIADDMGLGKTLVVLAAVAHSLEDAKDFARKSSVDEAVAKKPSRIPVKTTLVVVSAALILDVWINEASERMEKDTLKVYKYHGQNKNIDYEKLAEYDVVVTTYGTVAYDYHRNTQRYLFGVEWFRIVLDEAHVIRTQSTKQFQSIISLYGKHRWCLSGTPIQNKVEDVGSLIKFLRVPDFESAKVFQQYISSEVKSGKPDRFNNLRTLLGSLCIRRTKELLDLPEPCMEEKSVVQSAVETREYRNILLRFKANREQAIRLGKPKDARTSVPSMYLRLRIFCNTGTHVFNDLSDTDTHVDDEELFSLLQQTDEALCAQCSNEITSIEVKSHGRCGRFLSCGHLLCVACISDFDDYNNEESQSNNEEQCCPRCFEQDSTEQTEDLMTVEKPVPKVNDTACGTTFEQVQKCSSKLNALIEDVMNSPFGTKSLVFSSWTRTLDVVADLLQQHNIPFRRIHGDMSVAERRKALDAFKCSQQVPLLLMTIGCGAEGLSLVTANTIHIIEPQWNPAMENQAIGRAVRLGQIHRVRVVRYTVRNTIEEKVKKYQQEKIKLAGGGFVRQRTEDMERELLEHMDEVLAGWQPQDEVMSM